MKKTKMVCTIGPASDSKEVLRELFKKGLNVCRLNFSHGDHEGHQKTIDNIKAVREELDLPIGIMLDTKGPEIRLGDFKDGPITLEYGDEFILTTREILGDKTIVNQSYKELPRDVEVGTIILIDDGLVELEVEEVLNDTDIKCIARNHGELSNHKGVNVPNVKLNLPSITEKDVNDILFGIKNEVEFIAPSFIRKADDVIQIRKILEENGADDIEIISKIENQEGIDNIDAILDASDGVMVARGDMGVEIRTEEIPLVQKRLIRKANEKGKSVITATQMLDSMIRNPRPTRAEVTDVANAILDGTGAIMLSGESAAGKYPVKAVETMHNIAVATENSENYKELFDIKVDESTISTTNAIGRATCTTAKELNASAIITATSSGHTSKAISKFRPKTPIIAATTERAVMRRLSLTWGVYPVLSPYTDSTDDVIDYSIHASLEKGYVKEGDLVVVTAGVPVGLAGSTNLLKVHTISEILVKGMGVGKGTAVGKVCRVETEEDMKNFQEGDILVTASTDKYMIDCIEKSSALVVEEGGLTSHAAIVGLSLKKPTIVGGKDALNKLTDGQLVTVDSVTGIVYKGEARVL